MLRSRRSPWPECLLGIPGIGAHLARNDLLGMPGIGAHLGPERLLVAGDVATTFYEREELPRADGGVWEERWTVKRSVSDGEPRTLYSQVVTNVYSSKVHREYEFVTRAESATAAFDVRRVEEDGGVNGCVVEHDYLTGGSCHFELQQPDESAPGSGGQYQEVVRESLSLGDGTTSPTGVVSERHKYWANRILERKQRCVTGGVDCPGTQTRTRTWELSADGGQKLTEAVRDERGHWTEYSFVVLDGGVEDPSPPTLVREGRAGLLARSVASSGSDAGEAAAQPAEVAPEREWYEWAYVGGEDSAQARSFGYQPYAKSRHRASVVKVPEQSITHVRLRPGTNLREAVIQEGYTYTFNPVGGAWTGEPVRRFLARFFFPEYRATTPQGGVDAYGRTLEVHGPCWVSSVDAEDCDVHTDGMGREVEIPVTRFEYGEDKYLAARIEYADCGTRNAGAVSCNETSRLKTTFDAYDVRGNLLESTDPNGLKTRMTYLVGQLIQVDVEDFEVGVRSTTYAYDGEGRVTQKRLSTGVVEHLCYRVGADEECTGGVDSDLLQWKARSAGEAPTSALERVSYHYELNSNRLVEERHYARVDGVEELRRVNHVAQDPFGRTTATWAGDVPSRSRTFAASGYDSADNLTRSGDAYHAPPPFCLAQAANGAEPSSVCSLFEYDSLDRLTVASSPESSSQGGQRVEACMAYDSNGNVRKVVQGCMEGCETCLEYDREKGKDKRVDWRVYAHDDFGRLAWMEGPEMTRPARFQYDAMGNVILRNTATMEEGRHVETQYDSLGRALRVGLSDGSALHYFEYDRLYPFDGGLGCPEPWAHTGALGRLVRRTDTMGSHWYVYNRFGDVTSLHRQRTGRTCFENPADTDAAPTSRYEYDEFGRLVREEYPHGLYLMYSYGEGNTALPDQVRSIQYGMAAEDGGVLVSDVRYEPYGGVRSYTLNTGETPTHVEWLTGRTGTPPVSDTCGGRPSSDGSASEADVTGQVRALWVSRAGEGAVRKGDVFKQVYTWRGGQRIRRRHLSPGRQEADSLFRWVLCDDALGVEGGTTGEGGYDERLQLVSMVRPEHEWVVRGGTVGRRGFSLDALGNRTEEVRECSVLTNTFAVGRASSRSRRCDRRVAPRTAEASPATSPMRDSGPGGRATPKAG